MATAALHTVFGVFGDATGLFLFLAPTITFKRIVKKKSTEQFSGIPYVMTLLNCLLSAWYGLPFISENNKLVSVINGTGAGIEAIYVIVFLIFAPKKEKTKIFGLLMVVLAIFATVAFVSVFALHSKHRRILCGFAAAIFSIIMYGSPLSIMRMVIKTKSVEFMPFFLSLFVFLCGTSWFVFGLLGNDPFVYVPNGFGTLLGTLQLILYAIYGNNKGGKDTEKPFTTTIASKEELTSSALEMGLSDSNGKKKPHHEEDEKKQTTTHPTQNGHL